MTSIPGPQGRSRGYDGMKYRTFHRDRMVSMLHKVTSVETRYERRLNA